ncbi:MAG: prephenate dehydrogenase [Oscillibacter sp.]|nr:prephenate dehydrogenase [Dysosmobacter sp.]MDD6409526.1 prephenate dehydrogenase [Oscillibacter sp.]MDY3866981.1 prephenate dehydrogenase [Dysosmobacter sp.]
MTVGIVGLGLIGGSFAKAYHAAGHTVLAFDTDRSTYDFAVLSGTVNGPLTDETLSTCDLILMAVIPSAAVGYLKQHAAHIGPKPVVIDCCGTKRVVCTACFPLAKQFGFTYLGGHPMAGTHNSGFKYATATMFHNAPMVLVPANHNDIELLSRVKELLAPAGFSRFSVTTAEQHDEMIAFTSQLAHVVSNAYIKSPTAGLHKGFSAGSYKDMTRVAWLAPKMWAELFLENKDFLMAELNTLIDNLRQYQDAMEHDDLPGLIQLLDDGRKRKEEVDGR